MPKIGGLASKSAQQLVNIPSNLYPRVNLSKRLIVGGPENLSLLDRVSNHGLDDTVRVASRCYVSRQLSAVQ